MLLAKPFLIIILVFLTASGAPKKSSQTVVQLLLKRTSRRPLIVSVPPVVSGGTIPSRSYKRMAVGALYRVVSRRPLHLRRAPVSQCVPMYVSSTAAQRKHVPSSQCALFTASGDMHWQCSPVTPDWHAHVPSLRTLPKLLHCVMLVVYWQASPVTPLVHGGLLLTHDDDSWNRTSTTARRWMCGRRSTGGDACCTRRFCAAAIMASVSLICSHDGRRVYVVFLMCSNDDRRVPFRSNPIAATDVRCRPTRTSQFGPTCNRES